MGINRRTFLVASAAIAGSGATNRVSAAGAGRGDPPVPLQSQSALPISVRDLFASRSHRLHHALWHGLRDLWQHPSTTEETRREIQRLGWKPPRSAQRWLRGGWMPETANGSGIDFLFMHREMIAEFDREVVKAGYPPHVGWEVVPEPGKPDILREGFEVPSEWDLPSGLRWLQRRFAVVKSDEFYWSRMRWWDRDFHNHAYLRTITLGQLGSLLETSIHNDMHMRWAGTPIDPDTGEVLVLGRPDTSIDPKWDNPIYDFLGETYSSHVNPVFWKLHKWVDGIVEEWFEAHEVFSPGRIKKVEVDGVRWYESKEWVEVDSPWSSPGSHAKHDVQTMEKVYRALYPETSLTASIEGATSAPRNWF